MNRIALIALASAASLGLAACGEAEVDEAPIGEIDGALDPDNEDLGYPVGGELTPEQQTAFDAIDRQAVSDEYDATIQAVRQEPADATTGSAAEGTTATAGGATATAGGTTPGTTGTGIPPRSQMTFSWLDRNGDGRLSVAEYAIWALPADPTEPAPNDARPPYLTAEEINTAGQTFFYFDEDGSTYLSQSEFDAARASARTP